MPKFNDYVRGTLEGDRHVWVKVDIDDKIYLFDPINNLFGYMAIFFLIGPIKRERIK